MTCLNYCSRCLLNQYFDRNTEVCANYYDKMDINVDVTQPNKDFMQDSTGRGSDDSTDLDSNGVLELSQDTTLLEVKNVF